MIELETVASASEVAFSYGGGFSLSNITLQIPRGRSLCILGANGAGKSTLLDLFVGHLAPSSGQILVHDAPPGSERARTMTGFAPQTPAFPPMLTVREVVSYVSAFHDRPRPLSESLELFDLSSFATTRVERLSWGYQKRLQLCCSLAGMPHLWILDEPTSGLDIDSRNLLLNNISDFVADGGSVIWTTHLLQDIELVDGDVAVLVAGAIGLAGNAQVLLSEVQLAAWSVPWTPELQAVMGSRATRSGAYARIVFAVDQEPEIRRLLGMAHVDESNVVAKEISFADHYHTMLTAGGILHER